MSTETGRFAYTPSRRLDKPNEQEMSTEAKKRSPDIADSNQQNENSEQALNAIQSRIKEIGQQLRTLNNKMILETDKLSNQYIEMENSRKELKKELLELDYQHKLMCTVKLRESKMANEEKISEIRKQYEGQLSKLKQSQKPQEQQKLAESRRKLRMAEIEAELAESKLRRSRLDRLNEQMKYLRLTYTDPLLWRSYLSWPSYYYYPYYSSYYRPYYSSYYSSYYSPYSQYRYPYYRWWLY